MNISNIKDAREWFQVLQTSEKSQTAVMTLKPGGASGENLNAHKGSEQVLLVLEGEVEAQLGGEKRKLSEGDAIIVPAGVKHRFSNSGQSTAVTFSVYAPPEYPPHTAG